MRKGISPIITVMLLVLIMMGVVTSISMFVFNQQENVAGRLSSGFGDQLNVVETVCNERNLSMKIENTGEEEYDTGKAELIVREDGIMNSTLSEPDITVEGEFQKAGETGFYNHSMEGFFRSGKDYEITIGLDTGKEISELCRGGYHWWDRDWMYRKNMILSTSEATSSGSVVEVVLDTGDLIDRGVMRNDCEDIRIVEKTVPRNHTIVSGCGTSETVIRFRTNITEGRDMDTYVYYGNLRATGRGNLEQDTEVSPEYRIMEEEER